MTRKYRKNITTIPEQIYTLLQDGKPHHINELHAFCGPSSRGVVFFHILKVRKMVPEGQAVLCVIVNRSLHYQLVNLVIPNV
jgi:hypothetical protein